MSKKFEEREKGFEKKFVRDEELQFKGPARVFECEEDAMKWVQEGNISSGDVLVIRNEGPQGGPGMREMLGVTAAVVGQGHESDRPARGLADGVGSRRVDGCAVLGPGVREGRHVRDGWSL